MSTVLPEPKVRARSPPTTPNMKTCEAGRCSGAAHNMEFKGLRVNRIRKTWKQHLATPGGLVVKIATHSDTAALRRHPFLVSSDCAKPRKTWIEQNTLGARVWQCKCLTPGRHEKQTRTSRSQPFTHSHNNSPLQQCNSFSPMLAKVLGATTQHFFVLHSAADFGRIGGGAECASGGSAGFID